MHPNGARHCGPHTPAGAGCWRSPRASGTLLVEPLVPQGPEKLSRLQEPRVTHRNQDGQSLPPTPSFPCLLLTELSTVPPGAGDKSGLRPERQHPGSGHRPNRTGTQRTGLFAHLPLQVFVHCTLEFLFTLLGFFISSLGNLRLLEVMFL